MSAERQILSQEDVRRALNRVAHEILERNRGAEDLVIVGIYTRGVPLANRLADNIAKFEGSAAPVAALDINLYRDDLQERDRPVVRPTDISVDIHGKIVVLVDDVLYTGRTIRAALDALSDFGRPKEVQLAILLDRGHRELPIRPDYVGQNIPTSEDEQVKVRLVESDGVDGVAITKRGAAKLMTAPRAIEAQEPTQAPELADLPPRKHVLDLDDFSPAEISAVLQSAQGMAEVLGRDIKKVPHPEGQGRGDLVLRVQHPNPGLVRGSRQGIERRRHQHVGFGQQCREGRVPAQYRPHPAGHGS